MAKTRSLVGFRVRNYAKVESARWHSRATSPYSVPLMVGTFHNHRQSAWTRHPRRILNSPRQHMYRRPSCRNWKYTCTTTMAIESRMTLTIVRVYNKGCSRIKCMGGAGGTYFLTSPHTPTKCETNHHQLKRL